MEASSLVNKMDRTDLAKLKAAFEAEQAQSEAERNTRRATMLGTVDESGELGKEDPNMSPIRKTNDGDGDFSV